MSRRPAADPRRARLVRALMSALQDDPAQDAARAFAEQAAADAAPDELPELSARELAENLADFWRFGQRRRGRGPLIRVLDGLGKGRPLDRLDVLQDDAPFLVDSIMGEIAARAADVVIVNDADLERLASVANQVWDRFLAPDAAEPSAD